MRTLILAALLASAPALADPTPDAKHLYDEGLRHYNLAEYPQAIEAWKQAYLLSKKPLLLFNIGQAFRLAGDCTQAITFYDSYTREEPAPKNQDELDQVVAQCKDKLAAAIAAHPVPPPDKPPVPPPQPPPQPTPVAPAPPPPVAHRDLRTVGWIAVAGGALLEGGALYFARDGRKLADQLATVKIWTATEDAQQSRGHRDNILAWGLGIAGGAAVIAGAILVVTGGPAAESGPSVAIGPGGARVGWSFSF